MRGVYGSESRGGFRGRSGRMAADKNKNGEERGDGKDGVKRRHDHEREVGG